MSFNIQQMEPSIILVNFNADFSVGSDMENLTTDLHALLEGASAKVTVINNLDAARFTVDDVIQSASLAKKRESSLFHHPKVQQILCVTSSKLIQLSAKGLNHEVFGGLKLPVFGTLDEALDYARSHQPIME
jgi:hypothetical protein